MKDNNVKNKLNKLLADPSKGILKKGSGATLADLRARLENIERISRQPKATDSAIHRNSGTFFVDKPDKFREPNESTPSSKYDIQSLASVGQILHGEDEGFSLWENSFAPDHAHGELLLSSINRLSPESFSSFGSLIKDKRFDPQATMFIDTETTGLAGGTGTLAFLIGVGYFDHTGFKVRQYFMRDYGEETAALHALVKFASRFEHIVTFNGKGYDIPLLQARMVLNRIRFDFSSFSHIDLLYPSRKIFKHRLDDCRLSTLERFVIRFFREDDIPSEEIPYLYFRYLRSHNPALMDKVFYHNTMDIVSLAVLATRIAEILDENLIISDFGEDVFGAGHFYFSSGDYKKAERFFRKSFEYTLPYEIRYKLLTELSIILKRTGNIDEASEIWQGMIDGQKQFSIFPYIELAKYNEHHKKSFQSAIKIVEEAARKMQERKNDLDSHNYSIYQKELLRRLKRLEIKAGKHKW